MFLKITSDEGQPLDSVKVCVLDGHDSFVGEQLLGVIVDQLTVDEHVDVVLADLLNLNNNKNDLDQFSTTGQGGLIFK